MWLSAVACPVYLLRTGAVEEELIFSSRLQSGVGNYS